MARNPMEVLGALVDRRRGALPRGSHRARALSEELGSPHRSVPAVHVAGTDGKTSVVRMVAALLAALEARAGDTTSPHLGHLGERIRLDARPVPLAALAAATARLPAALQRAERRTGEPPTFFDVITTIALRVFADAECDLAVVEAGIGGTGDATEIVEAPVSVLTPIGIDHVELGTSLGEVAANKAGIVRPGAIVVCAAQHPAAGEVIQHAAATQGARLVVAGRDLRVEARRRVRGGQVASLVGLEGHRYDVRLPVHGAAQADNAVLALGAVQAALDTPDLDPAAVCAGFAAVQLPGRTEVVTAPQRPTVVIDGAHDELSSAALATTLDEGLGDGPVALVVGTSGGRDPAPLVTAVASRLAGRLRTIVATSAGTPGSTSSAVLGERLRSGHAEVVVSDSVADALDRAGRAVGPAGIVVAMGSLYLAAEVRDLTKAGSSQAAGILRRSRARGGEPVRWGA